MCVSACVDDLYEYINDMQNTQKQMGKIDSAIYVRINIKNNVKL